MIDFIARNILNRKGIVISVFAVITVICTVLFFFVPINYNMVDYLPQNAPSTKALKLLEKEFPGAMPNANVMLKNVSVTEALGIKKQLLALEGVLDVMWLDDSADLQKPVETLDGGLLSTYYKDGNALLSIAIASGQELDTTNEIYEVIGDKNALSGDAVTTAQAQKMAVTEMRNAIIIILPMILLILIISTTSWIEPVLFICAIGVSVLINLGTNIFLGEVSFVTMSASPVLQLAVSMDYAIFLLHTFNIERQLTPDIYAAMKNAMKKSVPAVSASAATTLFGFLALMFMDFGVGFDLGLNLVKGVIFSFVSVMIFLPALTILSCKAIDKTQHKSFFPKFKKLGSIVRALRIPVIIIVIVLIIPAFSAQKSNSFTYGIGDNEGQDRISLDTKEIGECFGRTTPIVVLIPNGNPANEKLLCDELSSVPHVNTVVSYSNSVGVSIPSEYLSHDIVSNFYSENLARIILYTDTPSEGDVAFSVIENVQKISDKYYDDAYLLGQSANLYDIKTVVERDNTVVNRIAIIAIALVVLVTFKSLALPLLLLLAIEAAIWINMAIPYFTGSSINFIGYLVVSTVQLGATIDYAILLSDRYRNKRKLLLPKPAITETVHETFPSILVSGSILAVAGFTLSLISTNAIVRELGMLLGRGTLLSVLLVVFFLPALLTFGDKFIRRTSLKTDFIRRPLERTDIDEK